MDVAGVVIGSIALFLALFSSSVAVFQLQHYVRFRRPVFAVRDARPLPVVVTGGDWGAGSVKVVVNARGARYPITFTKSEVVLLTSERGHAGVGAGVSSEGQGFTLQPEVWTTIELESVGIGAPGDPPARLRGEIYLSNPRDVFTVPLNFKLAGDGLTYYLDDGNERLKYEWRTHWRGHRRVKRVMTALRSFLPGRH